MKTATALMVRTVSEPPMPSAIASPEQWTLPLVPPSRPKARGPERPTPLTASASTFVQALVEVMAGDRPATQMAVWMSADVYDQLIRRLNLRACGSTRTRRTSARMASVHVAMLDADTAEIAARMIQAGRSRAIAMRLEQQPSFRGTKQWRCTALSWA